MTSTPPVTEPEAEPAPLEELGDAASDVTGQVTDLLAWFSTGQAVTLIAIGIFIVALTALLLIKRGLRRFTGPKREGESLRAIASRLRPRIRIYFLIALSLNIAIASVAAPEGAVATARIIFVLAGVLQLAELVQGAVLSFVQRLAVRGEEDGSVMASAVQIVSWFVNVVIWTAALLLILDNLQVDVTAIIAGLGFGGIAFALAAQGMFKNLFAAISILLDRPFQQGDMIQFDEVWGTVEEIGMRTTRIRAMDGEQIVISNVNLLEKEIHNLKRMAKRRVSRIVRLPYSAGSEKIDHAKTLIRDIIEAEQEAEFVRATLNAFGTFSVEIEFVFLVLGREYDHYKRVQDSVMMEVLRAFERESIEIAIPVQTINLSGQVGTLTSEDRFDPSSKEVD